MDNYKEMFVGKTITDVRETFDDGCLHSIQFDFSDHTSAALINPISIVPTPRVKFFDESGNPKYEFFLKPVLPSV